MDRFAGVLDRLREDWKRVDMAESDGEVRWAEVMPFIRRHDITAAELTAEIEKHIIGREDDIRAYCDGTGSVVSYLFGILKTARQNHNDRMAG